MTIQGFLSLAVQSITAPRQVARLLLAINPSREALITGFALVTVLNALTYGASTVLSGGDAMLAIRPTLFLFLQGATLAGTIVAVTFAGRGIGGAGRLEDVALLMIWLQALRVLVQGFILLLLPISVELGSLVVGIATVLGIWIAVHFVDEAHGFGNLWRAVLALILGVVATVFALSILLALAGVNPNGVTSHV